MSKHVVGLILAAGLASRMGQPKQLLAWGETSVLGQVIAQAQASQLSEFRVVTGHEQTAVTHIAQSYNTPTVYNPNYATGMMSSLQAGIQAVEKNATAVLVLLADQPMLTPTIIDAVLEAYQTGHHNLIRPADKSGRVGHPVLIAQKHFAELLALPHKATPRQLLKNHPVKKLLVADSAIYRDLDTPEDYKRMRSVYLERSSNP